jgi:hypothetical protein
MLMHFFLVIHIDPLHCKTKMPNLYGYSLLAGAGCQYAAGIHYRPGMGRLHCESNRLRLLSENTITIAITITASKESNRLQLLSNVIMITFMIT